MTSKSREIRIGVMIVAAIGLLFFGINYLKGINIFDPSNYYLAVYKNLDGLVPSNPVYINGYKVGQVDKIKYDFTKDSAFVVIISVDKNLKLPAGTRADLADAGLMGGKCIELAINNKATGYIPSGSTIPSGDTPNMMQSVKNDLLPSIANLIPKIDSLATALHDVAANPAIGKSLASFQRTTANLDQTSAQLKSLMSSDVPQLMTKVNTMADNFVAVSNNLRGIDFAATIASVNQTLANLQSASKKLNTTVNSTDGTLGLLLNDKTLYNNLTNMTGNANDLMIDLKANPKRYVHFSVWGSK